MQSDAATGIVAATHKPISTLASVSRIVIRRIVFSSGEPSHTDGKTVAYARMEHTGASRR